APSSGRADADADEDADEHADEDERDGPEPAAGRAAGREIHAGYAVVLRPALAAPVLATPHVHVPGGFNAYMTVTAYRGGKALKTWQGHGRWDGDLPNEFHGRVQDQRIAWMDNAIAARSIRVGTDADGRGGKFLEDWLDPRADAIILVVVPGDAATGAGTAAGAGEEDAAASAGAAGGGGRDGGGTAGGGTAGEQGARHGKRGGVTAERGGVDSATSRITGTAHGAAHGAIGGDGERGDHGVRGGGALLGGLISVPAALRPLVETLLILEDANPGKLAASWIKKRVAGRAAHVIRGELRRDAADYAEARIRRKRAAISKDKAFQQLIPRERNRFLQRMEWDIER